MSNLLTRGRLCAVCIRRLRASGPVTASSSSSQYDGRLGQSSRSSTRVIPARPIRAFSTSMTARAKKPILEPASSKHVNMEEFPRERIRNLSIIAHIDHGKSTLADRLLQMTGTVPASSNPQFLDKLKVERERGITVKAQTVSIIHTHPKDGQKYLINLIDTPGHVDFSYEVSRSIGACEGGLILVDCTQGIQAQTLSVFHVALEADLKLLAVINKVDLPHASPEETSTQIEGTFGLEKEDHMYISAKSGLGVDTVLNSIVESLPPPREWEEPDGKLRALVFDTHYDHYRGVVALIRIHSGEVRVGDKIRFLQANRKYEVLEIGINNPEETPVEVLKQGQVGYLICSMKNSEEAHIGDTICLERDPVEALPGFKPMKAMVYAGVFPMDSADFNRLEEAMERLTLNDRSVIVARESSAALSQGFRLGFLGTLHMDVFKQRLEDEYSSNVIITAPTVPYRVTFTNGKETIISNPTEFPDPGDRTKIQHVEEPVVNATIIVPNEYIGQMMDLCSNYRGTQLDYRVLETSGRSMLKYLFPLSEIVTDFFSALKSASSGFASFDYEDAGYEQSDMVKMNILLNGKPVDALAMIVHRSAAQKIGKEWVKKLKDVVPRQLFELAIQAAIGGKVIARETLQANRKDVTAGLYGGHYERKLKQLNKQKEGKKRLKMLAGNIEVPQAAFFQVLSSRPRSFSTSARQFAQLDSGSFLEHEHFPPNMLSSARSFTTLDTPQGNPDDINGDPVSQHLDDTLPRLDTFPGHPRPHRPIRRDELSPRRRAYTFSRMYKASSLDKSQVSTDEVYDTYTSTYFATSQGQELTQHELLGVARQLDSVASTRTHGDNRLAIAGKQAETLRHVNRSAEPKLRYTARLDAINTQRNSYKMTSRMADEMEQALEEMVDDLKRAKRGLSADQPILNVISAEIDQVLEMLAEYSAGSSNFERWWNELSSTKTTSADGGMKAAWTPSGRSHIARLRWATARDAGMVRQVLQEAVDTLDDSTPVLNAALRHYATSGEWGTSWAIYRRMTGRGADATGLPAAEISLPIRIPDSATASRSTYLTMIQELSRVGFLVPTMTVISDMLAAGHAMHNDVYTALFGAFAAWGDQEQIHGSAWSLFPPVGKTRRSQFGYGYGGSAGGQRSRQGRFASRGGRGGAEVTRIWSETLAVPDGRGSFAYDVPAHMARSSSASSSSGTSSTAQEGDTPGEADTSGWSLELLQTFFAQFLDVRPLARGVKLANRAPSPDEVWHILFAFSRTSGGNVEMVWDAWRRIERKFGDARVGEDATQAGDEGIEEVDASESAIGGEGLDGETGMQEERRESQTRQMSRRANERWIGWTINPRLERVLAGLERRIKENEVPVHKPVWAA